MLLIYGSHQNAQPNDIRYLPPEYDCTPTKRIRIEASGSPNTSTALTPKKYDTLIIVNDEVFVLSHRCGFSHTC